MALQQPHTFRVRATLSAADLAALQPLREIGDTHKSQFWDGEDIQNALRVANLRGIQPESLSAPRHHGRQAAILTP